MRKEGNKFSDVDDKTKVFRIVRSPITKTLKFIVFLMVIALEVLLVYKVRYSFLTYPLTKNAVKDYYLSTDTQTGKLMNLREEYDAAEFQQLFDYVDEWELDAKNKMYVILDSDAMKLVFEYVNEKDINYVITKFNNDATFREDIKYMVDNINKSLSRLMREVPKDQLDRLESIVGPIIDFSSYVIDYTQALDVFEAWFKWAIEEYHYSEASLTTSEANIDKYIQIGVDYSKGKTFDEIKSSYK